MTIEAIVAPSKPTLKRPPLYDVILFDDEVSTYQCVINILVNHFNTNEDDAFLIASKVDVGGIASAGVVKLQYFWVTETFLQRCNTHISTQLLLLKRQPTF